MTNERECLLRKICVISFAMDDTRLFLDTHPCDSEATCYFEKLCDMRNSAVDEYVTKYGPLSFYDCLDGADPHTEAPQPWEKGANV